MKNITFGLVTLVISMSIVACRPAPRNEAAETPVGVLKDGFVLRSAQVSEGGMLPKEFTCDGASATLPLEWSGAPNGTASFALVMHHVPGPGDTHWYWVLYDIPASTHALSKNAKDAGVFGNNSVNERTEYAPPCSKGPGAKTYTYTLYALSAKPEISLPANKVTRAVLLDAIKDRTLARAELNVIYSR
jgi:phosphatidylethanolamine-binding protein (PEBP) family uncharacterized protein